MTCCGIRKSKNNSDILEGYAGIYNSFNQILDGLFMYHNNIAVAGLLALRPGAISKFIWRRELNGETPFNHIY